MECFYTEMVVVVVKPLPELAKRTWRRRTPPPAQRRPSPKGFPLPELTALLPWKKSPGPGVRFVAESTRSSVAMLVEPDAERIPPLPVSLAQPSPAPLLLPHGQAVPLPSPEQYELPGSEGATVTAPTIPKKK